MPDLTIHYPDALFAAAGKSKEALEKDLAFELAIRLFQQGRISLGAAAELAGLPKTTLMDELGRLRVPVINFDRDEIEAEIRASRGDYNRG